MNKVLACATIFLFGFSVSVRAETQCHVVAIAPSTLNWASEPSVARFDLSLGLLREVRFTLSGSILGALGIENSSPNPQNLTGTLSAILTLMDPTFAPIAAMSVAAPPQPFALGPFDGVFDFGGTSGATISGLSATNLVAVSVPYPSATAALFVGPPSSPGTVLTPIAAQGSSFFAGNNGNEASQIYLSASASLEVCYVFDRDCNGNGIADAQDITAGTSIDVNGNAVPDECEYSITPGLCPGDGTGNACPCGNTGIPGSGAGCANSTGAGGVLVATGVARISADTVLLSASGMPASTTTLFFQGTMSLNSDLGASFGDGLRCAGGTIRRLGTRATQGGMATFPLAGGPGIATIGGVTPGARVYQSWYRNALAFCTPSTFNLTSGVRIVWGV